MKIFVLSSLASNISFADSNPRLFFPLDKSDFRILPQRFEYSMVDKDHLQIGDILIDATKIDIELGKKGAATFHWPAGLVKSGEIIIQDSVGKAVWKTPFTEKSIHVESSTQSIGSDQTLRTDTASLTAATIPQTTYGRLQIMPFFRFCVHREDAKTKIFICSKDLYFQKIGSGLSVMSRDTTRKNSFVEINGRKVGNNGIVFLQSTADLIRMRGLMLSGAYIEVDTRMKNIDLRDVYKREDGKIVVAAKGAEPARKDQILEREGDIWTTALESDHPAIYLLGEGDIPMRQDFVMGKNIRPESLQVEVLGSKGVLTNLFTYSSTVSVELKAPDNVTLAPYDNKSVISKDTNGTWHWELGKFEPDEENRRLVSATTPDGTFVGGADLLKGRPFAASANLGLYPFEATLQFEQFLTPNWSWQASYEMHIQKQSFEPGLTDLNAQARYSFSPTLYNLGTGFALLAGADIYSSDKFSVNLLNVAGEYTFNSPAFTKKFFDWVVLQVKLPVVSLTSGYTLGMSNVLEANLERKSGDWAWLLGLRYEALNFVSKSETDFYRGTINAGITRFF